MPKNTKESFDSGSHNSDKSSRSNDKLTPNLFAYQTAGQYIDSTPTAFRIDVADGTDEFTGSGGADLLPSAVARAMPGVARGTPAERRAGACLQ